MIHIMIADDQTLMRDALQTIVSLEKDMLVVGLAKDGIQALELVRELRPTLILMDIQMPGMDGIECTKQIKQLYPDTVILILTTFSDDDYIVEGLASGAAGFLLKDMPGERLVQAIRDAVSGQFMLPSVIAGKLAARLSRVSQTTQVRMDPAKRRGEGALSFTMREKSIIHLLLEGKTNRQMADLLLMSEGTVKNYVSSIYAKIGTNDRTLAIIALKEWLQTEPS
jgi:DNA-binding NarL/FixJ family response regulator